MALSTDFEIPRFEHGEDIVTCPYCGSRTEFMERADTQLHWCQDEACQAVFLSVQEDK